MWKLVIEDDEAKRTSVPLTRDDYTIGRKEGNTIRLTERNVSREHAKIRKNQNGAHSPESPFVLEDMNSYNGVYVNGLRVAQPQKLQHGDLIQIGDYRIILQDEALSEDAAMQSATTQDMKSTVPTGVVSRASLLLERPNRLVMLAGPTPGAEYPLDKERTTIGRAEDCNVSVNHNSVSRLHCEVHSLGEGRYEVVDKGSSNGVRVNGSDLRRSIVEPGDIIELGDVRFRFVGAGQIFLPGVGDSQQLEAIPDRPPASLRPAQGSSTSLVPFVIVGALVAVAVVVGFAVYQHQQQAQAPVADTAHASNEDPEQISLRAAKKLCDDGKCDVAHDKLILDIAKTSTLRQSSDYQTIETRWADDVLARADREPDATKKRALLRLVTDDDGVPLTRRNVANAKLAELDAATSVTPTATNVATAEPTHAATAPTHTGSNPTPTATAAPTATHTVSHPRASNVLQQASALSLAGDNAGARALLEPHVFGGHGSPEEVRMLKGICKAQHDKECVAAIEKKYP